MLVSLRDHGFLEQLGAKRGARYRLCVPYQARVHVPISIQGVLPLDSSFGTSLPDGDVNSTSSTTDSTNSDGNSINSAVDSTTTGTQEGNLPTDDAAHHWRRLENIAEPIRSQQRVSPEIREAVILGLCAIMPLTLGQLGALSGRSKNALRLSIAPLVASGRLRYFYPEPNHPRQKYVTTPTSVLPTDEVV